MRRGKLPAAVCMSFLCAWGTTADGADSRVAIGLAVTGDAVENGLFGDRAFPAAATIDGITGNTLFVARLSGGGSPVAIFTRAGAAPPQALVAAGSPSPTGNDFQDFLSPAGCSPHLSFWSDLSGPSLAEAGGSAIFLLDGITVSTVAVAGDAAPGGGTYMGLGSSPQVDALGRVVFLATIDGEGSAALFLKDGPVVSRLLWQDGPAPGGGTISELGAPVFHCDSTLALRITVDESGSLHPGLVRGPPGQLTRVAMAGDSLPGGSSLTGIVSRPALGPGGDVFINATDSAGPLLLNISPQGSFSILARQGDATPVGGQVAELGPPAAYAAGKVAWLAGLASGTGLPPGAQHAAVLAADVAGGDLQVLAAPGQASPFGGPVSSLDDPLAGHSGEVLLQLRATGPAPRDALVRWSGSGLSAVAATGDSSAAGTLLGGGYHQTRPSVSSAGEIAFTGLLSRLPADQGLFRVTAGSAPALVVMEGEALAGLGTVESIIGPPGIAADGEITVAVTMQGDSAFSYLVHPPSGPPALRLTPGMTSPLGGTFRTFGPAFSVSPAGHLAFAATLNGSSASSGIFVADGTTSLAVAAAGQAAPGGGTFVGFGFSPAAADDGVAFLGFVSGTPPAGALFLSAYDGQHLSPPALVAATGDAAPGGLTFARFFEPRAGGAGRLAFRAELDDGTAAAFLFDGLAVGRLAGPGDPFPGGGVIESVGDPVMDESGRIYAVVTRDSPSLTATLEITPASTGVLLSTGSPGPRGGTLGPAASLAAAGNGQLVGVTDLLGWSPGAAVVAMALDSDGDGQGDPVDCAPADPGAFLVPPPAEIRLVLPGAQPDSALIWWHEEASSAGTGTTYDVLEGELGRLRTQAVFDDAGCAAGSVAGLHLQVAAPTASAGDGLWFLVRAVNACGGGGIGWADISKPATESARGPLSTLSCSAP